MLKLTDKEIDLLARQVKPRGRPPVYDIDGLMPWQVFEIPAHVEGAKLLSAVNAIQKAGKRRGWEMVRVGTHRMVRRGAPGTMPNKGSGF